MSHLASIPKVDKAKTLIPIQGWDNLEVTLQRFNIPSRDWCVQTVDGRRLTKN